MPRRKWSEEDREQPVRRFLSGNRLGARWNEISKNATLPDGSRIARPSLTLTLHKLYHKGDLELPIRFPRTGVQIRYRLRQGPHWTRNPRAAPEEDLEEVSVVNIEGPPLSRPELWRRKRTRGGNEILVRVRRKGKWIEAEGEITRGS